MKIPIKLQSLKALWLVALLLIVLPSVALATEDTHTVTFQIDGEVISTQEVAHGENAALPEIPEKFGYTQIPPKWNHDGKNITADITIEAEYTLNQYVVTYMDEYGVYKTLTYLHGEKVEMVVAPFKQGYVVTWDTTIDTLTEDITVNAVYTEVTQVIPEQPEQPEPDERDGGDNTVWMIVILAATAALIGVFVLLYKQKKKIDREKS